jgi:hypothetical protein
MYPSRDLKVLAERRAFLQRRIEYRREECIDAGHRVAQGVERFISWGRVLRVGGLLGAVGSGILGLRRRRAEADGAEDESGEGGESWGTKALRWAPVALKAVRILSSFV